MTFPSVMDRTYHFITSRMVESGQAPHYTEIAKELGVSMEEGRQTLHSLIAMRGRILSRLSPRSTISPLSFVSRSTASRNGLVNEPLNRWRSAGSSPAKQWSLTLPVWIAVNRFIWRSKTGLF